MAIEAAPARRRVVTLTNLACLQIRFVFETTNNFQDVIAFMRVLAFDCLIREEERTTWSEMREEAAVSFVEAFRAGDSIAFVFYLSFLSAVDARIAEDEKFRASIQDY